MSDLFVRSVDGSDADNGTTWALAKLTVGSATGAASIDAAGDRIFLAAAHSESFNATTTLSFAGTLANPVQLICVDDTGDPTPPTVLAQGAVIATGAGAYSLVVAGLGLYAQGVVFKAGVGSGSSLSFVIANTDGSHHEYVSCEFWIATASASVALTLGSASTGLESSINWQSCWVKFAATGQTIKPTQCKFRWSGGGLLSGGSSPTSLVSMQNDQVDTLIEGLDLTNASVGINLFNFTGAGAGTAVARNIVMPSGWTGALSDAPTAFNVRIEGYNIDSGDTNYRCYIKDYAGSLTVDDALYRSPGLGASSWMYNGTTQVVGVSHKLTTSANASYPTIGFEGIELVGLNTTIDPTTSHVITCFFTTPGQADFTPLSNKDIGLRVQYPGNSASPQGKFVDDIMVLLATEADQDVDTAGDWDDALGAWVASTSYSIGAVVRPTTPNGKTYYCSVAGTSHTVEPTWLTTEGGETAEGAGTARWRCMHRQKMVVTLDVTAGKIRERGWLHLIPVLYLASAVAWIDPQASVTSS